jgi:hypothetical protein
MADAGVPSEMSIHVAPFHCTMEPAAVATQKEGPRHDRSLRSVGPAGTATDVQPTPFHVWAVGWGVPLFVEPTAMQNPALGQETAARTPTLGLGTGAQLVPFHTSASACGDGILLPTAMQKPVVGQDTAHNVDCCPGTLGVGTVVQEVPFQLMAKADCEPESRPVDPTAMQNAGPVQDTPPKTEVGSASVGVIAQPDPVHSWAYAKLPPGALVEGLPPTAMQNAALVQLTPFSWFVPGAKRKAGLAAPAEALGTTRQRAAAKASPNPTLRPPARPMNRSRTIAPPFVGVSLALLGGEWEGILSAEKISDPHASFALGLLNTRSHLYCDSS